jgi:hypothetical protein
MGAVPVVVSSIVSATSVVEAASTRRQ